MIKSINKVIKESIYDDLDISSDDFKKAYYIAINEKHNNMLSNAEKNNNFAFLLTKEVDTNVCGQANKCETNAYNFVKQRLEEGKNNFYPVGGFYFWYKSLTPLEHWWVYDQQKKKHIEITPLSGKKPKCYAGIINFNINNQILNSNKVWDVDFFKGGHVYDKYFY